MDWLFGYGGSMMVLVLYFAATMFIGLVAWRYFPQSDPEGYILGGRGMGWFVAAFTLMATQYSALTFLGFPGTMSALDWAAMWPSRECTSAFRCCTGYFLPPVPGSWGVLSGT
jgi:Na+/proline symporter